MIAIPGPCGSGRCGGAGDGASGLFGVYDLRAGLKPDDWPDRGVYPQLLPLNYPGVCYVVGSSRWHDFFWREGQKEYYVNTIDIIIKNGAAFEAA